MNVIVICSVKPMLNDCDDPSEQKLLVEESAGAKSACWRQCMQIILLARLELRQSSIPVEAVEAVEAKGC